MTKTIITRKQKFQLTLNINKRNGSIKNSQFSTDPNQIFQKGVEINDYIYYK